MRKPITELMIDLYCAGWKFDRAEAERQLQDDTRLQQAYRDIGDFVYDMCVDEFQRGANSILARKATQ